MAPGQDGPLLLADFTCMDQQKQKRKQRKRDGSTVVGVHGDDDESCEGNAESEDDNVGEGGGGDNVGQERVRIICIEGRKAIKTWRKVRYGPSRIQAWWNSKRGGKSPSVRGAASQSQKDGDGDGK